MNNKLTDQISAAGKDNVDAALKLASLSVATAERLMRLQMEAAKAFVTEQSANAQALAGARDPESMLTMRSKLAEQAVERALGYSRSVYEIAAQTQHEIAGVMEERFNAMRQDMQGAMEEMFKNAPGGAEPALNAIKAAFASSQNAFDTMSKAAKQATDAAEANVKAIMSAANATKRK
ncbi:MAG: phasin family protein [Burkholderiales bacterium]